MLPCSLEKKYTQMAIVTIRPTDERLKSSRFHMSTKLAGKGKDALELPVLVILLAGVIECSGGVGTARGRGSGGVGGG